MGTVEVSFTMAPRYAGAMLKLSINIDVDDLEKGVAFYTEAFGLTPLHRFGAVGYEETVTPYEADGRSRLST